MVGILDLSIYGFLRFSCNLTLGHTAINSGHGEYTTFYAITANTAANIIKLAAETIHFFFLLQPFSLDCSRLFLCSGISVPEGK